MPAVVIAVVAAVSCLFYLYCIKPGRSRVKRMKPYEETLIAHRGLFEKHSDHPENSLSAFRRAVEQGFGVELDIQMSSDGYMMVFHDRSLERMCGDPRRLTQCTYEELRRLRLDHSDEKIPTLDEVLDVIDRKVPMIVEIKPEGKCIQTTQRVAERMDRYQGLWCMESFHPMAVRWMKRNRPDVIRGQLASNFLKMSIPCPYVLRFILTNMMCNCLARPDFIAYDHRFADSFSYRLIRKLFHVENVAWTIRNEEELRSAGKIFQVFIFDSFVPKTTEAARQTA